MTLRKKKIKLLQSILFLIALAIILSTYYKNSNDIGEKLISDSEINKIKKNKEDESSDVFYNIEYSGLDLSGNRYILNSDEAYTNKEAQDIIHMKRVKGNFYFKDNTNLVILSDEGIYNNRSLDMVFKKNVVAKYQQSELFGEKIEYLNLKKKLIVSENVKMKDVRGTIFAEKLLFDLEKKTVDIQSYKDRINANINLE